MEIKVPEWLEQAKHRREVAAKSGLHFHTDEHGAFTRCYHRCRNVLSSTEFWIGTTLSFPIEHFLWEKVWPLSAVSRWLGL